MLQFAQIRIEKYQIFRKWFLIWRVLYQVLNARVRDAVGGGGGGGGGEEGTET